MPRPVGVTPADIEMSEPEASHGGSDYESPQTSLPILPGEDQPPGV